MEVGVEEESVDVAVLVSPLDVEDVEVEFIELPLDPEPVIPPVAPAASIRERAIFSLVQVIVCVKGIINK